MNEEEVFFKCPYCGERISMLLDPSLSEQSYIEDCEVCCRPIQVTYTTNQGHIDSIQANQS